MTTATVVIPVLNGAATIGDTVNALLSQVGVPAGLEIIVVDNGSTDGTLEILKDLPITLLHCSTPGASACRNIGLATASGEILVTLDDDTLPTRTWLREMLKPFTTPEVVLVGGCTISFNPQTGSERYIERAGLFRPENSTQNPDFPFVTGGNLAVRRDAARAIGGWDEAMIRAEDIEFSTRLLDKFPYPIHYAASAVLFHRNRNTDAKLAAQAKGYGYGLALIYRRYPQRARWNLLKLSLVIWRILIRTITPELLRFGHAIGRVSAEELEFARYHRLWTLAFWYGFFTVQYKM